MRLLIGGVGDALWSGDQAGMIVHDLVEGQPGLVGPVVVHHVDLVVAVPVGDEGDLGGEDGLFAVDADDVVGGLVGDEAEVGPLGLVVLALDRLAGLDVVELPGERDRVAAGAPDLADEEDARPGWTPSP